MAGLNRREKTWISDSFGARVNFDPTERLLYSHDIAAMPGLFKPLVGRTIPDAVVQPGGPRDGRSPSCPGARDLRVTEASFPPGKASSWIFTA